MNSWSLLLFSRLSKKGSGVGAGVVVDKDLMKLKNSWFLRPFSRYSSKGMFDIGVEAAVVDASVLVGVSVVEAARESRNPIKSRLLLSFSRNSSKRRFALEAVVLVVAVVVVVLVVVVVDVVEVVVKEVVVVAGVVVVGEVVVVVAASDTVWLKKWNLSNQVASSFTSLASGIRIQFLKAQLLTENHFSPTPPTKNSLYGVRSRPNAKSRYF